MFEAFVKLAQEKFAVSSWKPNTGQWDLTGFYLIFITDFDFDQSLKEKFLYSKTKGRKEKKKWNVPVITEMHRLWFARGRVISLHNHLAQGDASRRTKFHFASGSMNIVE